MTNRPSKWFTDKAHLAAEAYGDSQRLADRGAIYRYLQVQSVDIGNYPFRGSGIVGLVSTFLDPVLTGPGLDIGCGNGQFLPLLAAQCEHVVAADLSEGMLAALPDGPWERQVADVEALPFADNSFEVVLANHMLYHCPDLMKALSELHRVLRPGGTLIATTNALGNFNEAYGLLALAASDALGTPAPALAPADERFTVETGAELLGTLFEDVSAHYTRGTLTFRDAEPLDALRAYFRSVKEEWAWRYQIDWPILEAALNRRIDELAASGPITISTRSGTLVAQRD